MNLILYTEQFEEGKKEKIDQTLSPEFLKISEEELNFKSPVHLQGEASVITDHLILKFSVTTEAEMLCSVCNRPVRFSIAAKEISHSLPLAEMESSIFDYTDLVRDEILLQIPQFVECNGGKCPERPQIEKFLKKPGNFPFADL
jgi:uncharacterized metal-binding protein YceD (DUF177 family)